MKSFIAIAIISVFAGHIHSMNDDEEFPSITGKSFDCGTKKHNDPPAIMSKLENFLRQNGHSCVLIIGSDEHKFIWCQKEICPETVRIENMYKDLFNRDPNNSDE